MLAEHDSLNTARTKTATDHLAEPDPATYHRQNSIES
jgi:hypothetical protein